MNHKKGYTPWANRPDTDNVIRIAPPPSATIYGAEETDPVEVELPKDPWEEAIKSLEWLTSTSQGQKIMNWTTFFAVIGAVIWFGKGLLGY